MKCVICNGEDIEFTDVQEEVHIKSDIVYVPINVPVCATCGERYYDRRTMQYLEKVEEDLANGEFALTEVGRVLTYE